ncbi:MAG: isocitrate/isopropylmalate dehydrogenase family protein [Hyphomicrobiaceae bacterium]|nr:isocitrate/isopropylmalate dehydrogenase family protein [Hyphomicrobiaceae bacterium]
MSAIGYPDPVQEAQHGSGRSSLAIGIMAGDDIGLEITPVVVDLMSAAADKAGLKIDWREIPIGRKALDSHGHTMPEGTLDALSSLDGWVLGPIGHRLYPKVPEAINPHPIIRRHFDMFCGIKPFKSYPGVPCIRPDVDLVFLRENNEGFQPDRNMFLGKGEFRPTEDVTISVRVITRRQSSRICRAAFEVARRRRKKVTAVHKDTVFKLSCGMFAEEFRRLAQDYPDVEAEEMMVDTFAHDIILKPTRFDVVVTTNMYGDILTDEAAALVGGLGMAPGIAVAPKHIMAQATHGSAPDIAGKGLANPFALLQSGTMMLDVLGTRLGLAAAREAARLLNAAVEGSIGDPASRTSDVGGTASTTEMGKRIKARI